MKQRRLIVMRHAKSSWQSGAESDHERPLNERGRRAAPLVAREMARRGWLPEVVISSDARRTAETWRLMAEALGDAAPAARFSPELYGGGLAEIRALAATVAAGVETLLVLGHNPGFEAAVEQLAGAPAAMTTANAALLTGAGTTWREALAGPWRLEAMLKPRELEGGAT